MHNQLDETTRAWGMACHLCALIGFAIPFGSILGPLIVWLTQKNKHPFIAEQGKESVNFQISMLIYLSSFMLAGFILSGGLKILVATLKIDSFNFNIYSFFSIDSAPLSTIYLSLFLVKFFFIALALITLVFIFELIVTLIAAIKAYNGQSYRYPFNLRFLK